MFPDNELKDSQLVAALGGKGPSYANRKKSNMLVRSIKPSDRARKCIALFSTESAKRQKIQGYTETAVVMAFVSYTFQSKAP